VAYFVLGYCTVLEASHAMTWLSPGAIVGGVTSALGFYHGKVT
jgi:hypothetical protein